MGPIEPNGENVLNFRKSYSFWVLTHTQTFIHKLQTNFFIFSIIGLSILRDDLSESQDGKSCCDAKIAHLRGEIGQYISGGNNVRTAQDMNDAKDSMKGVVSCQAVLVQINSKSVDEASAIKTVSKGIAKISNIELR